MGLPEDNKEMEGHSRKREVRAQTQDSAVTMAEEDVGLLRLEGGVKQSRTQQV